ncbi:MAG: hypothetical protein KVP17_005287 [Porospora cf. gigantea B]|uniref:uncharacterized protein n=1 Tax=Porospora cf. gigantea B TaxID=2853592 RepID=UPI0035718438|nr:MAG: hypothetical protein KVP17_005287 [Porospora cf. gigantea B]
MTRTQPYNLAPSVPSVRRRGRPPSKTVSDPAKRQAPVESPVAPPRPPQEPPRWFQPPQTNCLRTLFPFVERVPVDMERYRAAIARTSSPVALDAPVERQPTSIVPPACEQPQPEATSSSDERPAPTIQPLTTQLELLERSLEHEVMEAQREVQVLEAEYVTACLKDQPWFTSQMRMCLNPVKQEKKIKHTEEVKECHPPLESSVVFFKGNKHRMEMLADVCRDSEKWPDVLCPWSRTMLLSTPKLVKRPRDDVVG